MKNETRTLRYDLWTWLGVGLLVFLLAGCGGGSSSGRINDSPRAEKSVTIKRDSYGVPHVYATDTYGLFYGYGYALAQDRLFQMEMMKRAVLGRSAEVLGADYVNRDADSRSRFELSAIRDQLMALPEEDLNIFRGYAAGFNAWISEVMADPGELMPKQFLDMGFEPSEWSDLDVAMLYVGTMAGRYSHSSSEINNLRLLNQLIDQFGEVQGRELFDQVHWLEDPLAPTTVPREDMVTAVGDDLPSKTEGVDLELVANPKPARLAPVSEQVFARMSEREAA